MRIAAWVPPATLLALACSSSGGEIATKPDPTSTGVAGSQSVPVAGRAGASGAAGAAGASGVAGSPQALGGFGGQNAGAGGMAATCPPDGAKVPECPTAAPQSCAACVCGATTGCGVAWSECRDDAACARGLGCVLAGCPTQTCAIVAGTGHAKLVEVVACFGGTCALRCTGEEGGSGGTSGAAGVAGGAGSGGPGGAQGGGAPGANGGGAG